MPPWNRLSARGSKTAACATIGGLVAAPLTLAHYWLSGAGASFSFNLVFFGGIVAAFLAERGAAAPGRAAFGAGVLGGLPGLAWILPALLDTATSLATAWGLPTAAIVLVVSLGAAVLAISVVASLLGGLVGRWLASRFGQSSGPAAPA